MSNRARAGDRLGSALVVLVVYGTPLVLVLLPLAAFLVYSVWSMQDGRPVPDFTFDNFMKFGQSESYYGVFFTTLRMTALVALVALVAGYVVAYSVWRLKGRTRNLFLLLSVLPLSISYIVKIYSMRSILGLNGFLNQVLVGTGILDMPTKAFLFNQTTVTLAMTFIYLPFGILPIFLSLERIPQSLINAAEDLGASPGKVFRDVVLPLSLPGAIAGALFVMVLAMGDFLTPQMLGGTNGFTFGRAIWSQFGLAYNWPFGAALAVVLLVTVGIIMLCSSLVMRLVRQK